MKLVSIVGGVLLVVGLVVGSVGASPVAQEGCENSGSTSVKVVTTAATQGTHQDLVGSGGLFAPEPLFLTTVKTGNNSCIIATLSAFVKPADNFAMFQVLVGGVPMNGHIGSDEFFASIGAPQLQDLVADTPIVAEPDILDSVQYRMVSYTFYLKVAPGVHTVRVNWVGCCTLLPENINLSEVARATLLLQYR